MDISNLAGCQIFNAVQAPGDWQCVSLKERLELLYGRALRESDRRPGEVDVFGSNGIVGTHDVPWLMPPGILVGRKGTVGAVHFATRAFWPIDTVYYVRSLQNDCVRFLFHLLNYLPLQFLNAATGVPGLSRRDAYALRGMFPPPDEQRAIADVLDAIDEAIRRTSAAADAAGTLRRSLLHTAFGFRFTAEERTRSEIGLIPSSWSLLKGKDAFRVLTGGNTSVDLVRRPKASQQADAWFMKVDDLNTPINRRYIRSTAVPFRTRDNPTFRTLPVGTVVIAKRGAAIMKNRVRTTAVAVALDPNLMGLQALSGIRPEFLRYQLEWRNLSRYVESSGVPQLNNKDLYPRLFVRAPDDQQQAIIRVMRSADAYEDALSACASAFKVQRRSLRHDLLTGSRRAIRLLTPARSEQ